jgi:2-oxo-4-hydroxy-4-carboxy--5-ureidoimidazoline (OHCU) decarboxylase
MGDYKLPSISLVPSLSTPELAAILDHLFETCVPLHTLSVNLLRDENFSSYDDLIASVGVQLSDLAESSSTSDTQWLESILAAHPRLGEKKIESAQSKGEQAQLASEGDSDVDKLAGLNATYERNFPGLRYVVFVNGRDRTTIMDDMAARISRGDIALEKSEAIKVRS